MKRSEVVAWLLLVVVVVLACQVVKWRSLAIEAVGVMGQATEKLLSCRAENEAMVMAIQQACAPDPEPSPVVDDCSDFEGPTCWELTPPIANTRSRTFDQGTPD